MPTAVLEPVKSPVSHQPASSVVSVTWPGFMRQANEIYKAGNAHVVILHNNVNDYQDNHGRMASLRQLLMAATDDNYTRELMEKRGVAVQTPDASTRGTQKSEAKEKTTRICAIYVANEGLKFDSDKSRELFITILSKEYEKEIKANKMRPDFLSPFTFEAVLYTMSKWFESSKSIRQYNRRALREGTTQKSEAAMTFVISDCDGFFPAGNIASLNSDRMPIIYMRNWAKDKEIGNSNRIFLITRHLSEIHESLRGGVSGIATIAIPKPSTDDNEEFSRNFALNLEKRCNAMRLAGDPLVINGKEITGVEFAPGFDHRGVAIQGAGMSRIQIEQVFNDALCKGIPVDDVLVREAKQKCIEEESEGVVEFVHPTVSFKQVGGMEGFKLYCNEMIREPLRAGDKRTCSTGALMVGPPGVGKSWGAEALAYECGVNYVKINISKLFDGIVGGSEKKTDKMIDMLWAAAPCVAFMDEIESALGAGRVTKGDSNTGGRMFNSVMTLLSDPARVGKIVIMAATNRADLLDAALIRAGRFDVILPMLPPPISGQAAFDGRANILKALISKHGVKFDSDVEKTMNDPLTGLGKLLRDENHIWTGAEIEVVLKKATSTALRQKSKMITLAHWNHAMSMVIANTQDVEHQINMALYYANDLEYCEPEWVEQARDKVALAHILRGGEDYRVAS